MRDNPKLTQTHPNPQFELLKKEDISSPSKATHLINCKCCNNLHPKLLAKKDNFYLYECQGCGYIFSRSLDPAYKNEYPPWKETAPLVSSEETKEYLRRAVQWLPKKNLKILNIGYNDQKIVDLLKKSGHELLSINGLHDLNNEELLYNYENHFDVIINFNSITHVFDPKETFQTLFNLLDPFGLHVIYTDMHISIQEILKKLYYSKINTHYPYSVFRYESLEKLFDLLGHDIVYINPKMIMARKGLY